jgi:hypothetical protein
MSLPKGLRILRYLLPNQGLWLHSPLPPELVRAHLVARLSSAKFDQLQTARAAGVEPLPAPQRVFSGWVKENSFKLRNYQPNNESEKEAAGKQSNSNIWVGTQHPDINGGTRIWVRMQLHWLNALLGLLSQVFLTGTVLVSFLSFDEEGMGFAFSILLVVGVQLFWLWAGAVAMRSDTLRTVHTMQEVLALEILPETDWLLEHS